MEHGATYSENSPDIFADLLAGILAGEIPLVDLDQEFETLPESWVLPFAWVDCPGLPPLVLVEFRHPDTSFHAFAPFGLPRHAKKRFAKRLHKFARAFLSGNPLSDFDPVPASDALQYLHRYANNETPPRNHAVN